MVELVNFRRESSRKLWGIVEFDLPHCTCGKNYLIYLEHSKRNVYLTDFNCYKIKVQYISDQSLRT